MTPKWEVIHGDCLDVMRAMDLTGIDAVITDPPYGIGFAAQPTKWQRRAGHLPSSWDDSAPDIAHLFGFAPIVAVWGGNHFALPPSRGWLVWVKPDAPPSMGSVEMCWTNVDQPARHHVYSIGATNPERVGHPTQKPLSLMRWCLRMAGVQPGMTVLDPFLGSGTTGVAALEEGCRFIGIEREAEYVAIARARIQAAANAPMLDFTSPPAGEGS